ncbi:hypothetical protein [Desulfobulbus alkaliphilus]|uniref:hypothetical protein n=1 Tax=Desulfobulbus alkaliphilus TaxID=869814 RepID=UPI0019639BE9|nr:hypothetical protein [Desulfobulbus alkaliphilus]MBM9536171.1 hypothetical protein [Desulfobulbus alkaliphilus]
MENFKSLAAVLRHLHADGWQIARTQFYRHADEGKLERSPDGTYSLSAVVRYAERFCKRAATGKPLAASKATVAEQRDEIRLEREALKLESERLEFERLAGKLVSFNDVEDMTIARAVAMLAHLKAMAQMNAAEWIDLVGGDQARHRELIAAIWDAIEEQMATFARDIEFEVIFEAAVIPEVPATDDDDNPATGPSRSSDKRVV